MMQNERCNKAFEYLFFLLVVLFIGVPLSCLILLCSDGF